jgi:hypothetical protein
MIHRHEIKPAGFCRFLLSQNILILKRLLPTVGFFHRNACVFRSDTDEQIQADALNSSAAPFEARWSQPRRLYAAACGGRRVSWNVRLMGGGWEAMKELKNCFFKRTKCISVTVMLIPNGTELSVILLFRFFQKFPHVLSRVCFCAKGRTKQSQQ